MANIKIYLTNLGKYNEGELVGEWLNLPATVEEIAACKNRIGINPEYEEYFITDYECDVDGVEIGEYSNLEELNEIAEQLADFDEYRAHVFGWYLGNGYSLEDAVNYSEDYTVYEDCTDMADVAYYVVEECGYLESIPEHLRFYFDYEKFGRDLEIEGIYTWYNYNTCISIHNR